ncbi:MAG: hypothetical protein LBP19_07695 [Treponema sp.]|jgi:hypothetical protein|nr:hypothetical protein [Treponema sp.]
MKKLFFVILTSMAFVVLPLFAQDDQESDSNGFYYVKVPITKIYPYSKGYVVTYNVGTYGTELDTVYLPASWFSAKESKGFIINLERTPIVPNVTVYYQNGAFDHVKLYVRENRSDPIWGYMPLWTNIDDRFENVTDVPLKFGKQE